MIEMQMAVDPPQTRCLPQHAIKQFNCNPEPSADHCEIGAVTLSEGQSKGAMWTLTIEMKIVHSI